MKKDGRVFEVLRVKELKDILASVSDDTPLTVCMTDTGIFYLKNLALLHCDSEQDKDTLCFYANCSKDITLTIEDETSYCEKILWSAQKGEENEKG